MARATGGEIRASGQYKHTHAAGLLVIAPPSATEFAVSEMQFGLILFSQPGWL